MSVFSTEYLVMFFEIVSFSFKFPPSPLFKRWLENTKWQFRSGRTLATLNQN